MIFYGARGNVGSDGGAGVDGDDDLVIDLEGKGCGALGKLGILGGILGAGGGCFFV